MVDADRKLTDAERGRLSAREQAIFLCIHDKARSDFDQASSAKYEACRDAYIKAAKLRRQDYRQTMGKLKRRVAALAVLVGNDVIEGLNTALDDTFKASNSVSGDVAADDVLPESGISSGVSPDVLACLARINEFDDKQAEERYNNAIQAQAMVVQRQSIASASDARLKGAEAMFRYIYPFLEDRRLQGLSPEPALTLPYLKASCSPLCHQDANTTYASISPLQLTLLSHTSNRGFLRV